MSTRNGSSRPALDRPTEKEAGKTGGIDWASERHALCVVDEEGSRVRERLIGHSEAGIAALCRELVELEVERVAIERPDGILVERLLEAGGRGCSAVALRLVRSFLGTCTPLSVSTDHAVFNVQLWTQDSARVRRVYSELLQMGRQADLELWRTDLCPRLD